MNYIERSRRWSGRDGKTLSPPYPPHVWGGINTTPQSNKPPVCIYILYFALGIENGNSRRLYALIARPRRGNAQK